MGWSHLAAGCNSQAGKGSSLPLPFLAGLPLRESRRWPHESAGLLAPLPPPVPTMAILAPLSYGAILPWSGRRCAGPLSPAPLPPPPAPLRNVVPLLEKPWREAGMKPL